MLRSLLTTAALVMLATPALSAEFFIVQDAGSQQCRIVEQPPQSGGIVVGEGAYGDRGTAEAEMKVIHACLPRVSGSEPRPPQDVPANPR